MIWLKFKFCGITFGGIKLNFPSNQLYWRAYDNGKYIFLIL